MLNLIVFELDASVTSGTKWQQLYGNRIIKIKQVKTRAQIHTHIGYERFISCLLHTHLIGVKCWMESSDFDADKIAVWLVWLVVCAGYMAFIWMVGVRNATTHNDTHTKEAKKQVLKTIICIDRYLFSCHNIFLVCVLVFLASSKVALVHPHPHPHPHTHNHTHTLAHTVFHPLIALYLSFSTYSLSLDRFCLRCTFLSLLFFPVSPLRIWFALLVSLSMRRTHSFYAFARMVLVMVVAANSSVFLFIAYLTLVFTKADYFTMCHRNIRSFFFGGGSNNTNNNVYMHTYT